MKAAPALDITPVPVFVFDEGDIRVNRLPWHRDNAYMPTICEGAMLRMLEVSPAAGETLFADTALAYDELSSEVNVPLDPIDDGSPGGI